MGENNEQCCGTCQYHQRESIYGDFVCSNADSEYYDDWTDYDDGCFGWEPRQ